MKHLGSITDIRGDTVPIVDCVIGGSPCQNLSVAGNRKGLQGQESQLFLEQIRVIKEMREHDRRLRPDTDESLRRPRYMLWENVPGAFSSNGGEDFRRVLEETARIADESAIIPRPPKNKWRTAGCIMGNGWSIAWRVCNAEFFGVPQRRRRIALVADFGGESAPEILFVRKGSAGDFDSRQPQREATAGDAESGAGANCFSVENHPNDSRVSIREDGTVQSLTERMGTGGGNTPLVIMDRAAYNQGKNAQYDFVAEESDTNGALQSCSAQNTHGNNVVRQGYIVRRLTPMECERLQGYEDVWTDIGDYKDSNGKIQHTADAKRYKALGNSIALPAWRWIIRKLSAQYDTYPTMASLFDGIGGFPFLWEGINGKGTCLWASEIDEFCIAVTERRINGRI